MTMLLDNAVHNTIIVFIFIINSMSSSKHYDSAQ